MSGSPHFETPTALEYFATLVADDATLPVLEAAVAVAQDESPDLDVQGVLARIDGLADRLRRRIPADAAPLQRLRLLNRYFFQELGFAGNVNDYYDPRNSFLNDVLDRKIGIPISLAVVLMGVGERAGVPLAGTGMPVHFLVRVLGLEEPRFVDCFNGGGDLAPEGLRCPPGERRPGAREPRAGSDAS